MKKIHFTPGPSELYFTVEEHLKTAVKEGIGTISHRGNTFQTLYKKVDNELRTLLNLPENYTIIFTSSASEIWERTLLSCVLNESLHLVNGAFSKKFYDTAVDLGVNAIKVEAPHGSCASIHDAPTNINPELIAFTHNETSTGVSQPLDDIYAARDEFPNALIAVDVVSSLPAVDIDYSKVDSVYFSVQKCFGLPAGLGVWLVNDRCLTAAQAKEDKIGITTSAFRLTNSHRLAQKFQTVATPNVLSVFLLGKVVEDMNLKSIAMIRRETAYKAAVLYHAIEQHKSLTPFVDNKDYRSQTVVVAQVHDNQRIINKLAAKGFVVGTGYGDYKRAHLRIANFPTHSKEQIEMLSDFLLAVD